MRRTSSAPGHPAQSRGTIGTLLEAEASERPSIRPSFFVQQTLHKDESVLLLKEVIQPHLPVRLPCYDFVPITSHTLGSFILAVRSLTSGVTSFHDVTGGVYKTRERIHGAVADAPLLAIPSSCSRIADYNLN